ncbi:MAG: nucleoside triphosphate pyrophosphohydrolase [Bacillota bacterium]|nr:nucleoside triphosphate pyrophosphohydrolase [Bacillota bacterium]
MLKLTIIGTGTKKVNDISLEGFKTLKDNAFKYVRTDRHPFVEYLREENIKFETFDKYFEEMKNLNQVYESIIDEILKKFRTENTIYYYVPGSPYYGDVVTEYFIKNKVDDIKVEIIDSISFWQKAVSLVAGNNENIKTLSGEEYDFYDIDINSNLLFTQIFNKDIAEKIKLDLGEIYGDEHKVNIIDVILENTMEIPVLKVDKLKKYSFSTYIFVESIEKSTKELYNVNNLLKTMETLRGPDGCPWDRKQTHESIRDCLIEEAYEVVDAIEKEDYENFIEELGDLLLQVVFHAQIAREEGYFNIYDVSTGICKKLNERHPHVFGDVEAEDVDEALKSWEYIKGKEKKLDTYHEKLMGVPKALSPLTKSYKIQKIAAEVGFDWPDIKGAVSKIHEELDELLKEYDKFNKDKVEEELGDLLFAIVNFSRFLKINPDIALNRTVNKFIKRFKYIEDNSNKSLKDMSLEDMDELWEKSKRQ